MTCYFMGLRTLAPPVRLWSNPEICFQYALQTNTHSTTLKYPSRLLHGSDTTGNDLKSKSDQSLHLKKKVPLLAMKSLNTMKLQTVAQAEPLVNHARCQHAMLFLQYSSPVEVVPFSGSACLISH